MVVDLRRVGNRLEAEIARVVHAVADGRGVARMPGRRRSRRGWLLRRKVSMRSARDQVRLAGTLAAAPIVAEKMADG